jgi:hypothetical protein
MLFWYSISVTRSGMSPKTRPFGSAKMGLDSSRVISDTTLRWCLAFGFLKATVEIYRKAYFQFLAVTCKFMLNNEPVYDFGHSPALVTRVLRTTEAQKALCG